MVLCIVYDIGMVYVVVCNPNLYMVFACKVGSWRWYSEDFRCKVERNSVYCGTQFWVL